MGKTRLGAMAATTTKGRVVVVTSRLPLVDQWKEEIGDHEIYIINTASKLNIDCELLIIDEAHRATAPTFSRVFNIRYEKLLCLTATLPADEERAKYLTTKAPIVYSKTIDEAPEVSAPYQIFNVAIDMSKPSLGKYKVFDHMFKTANLELARVVKHTSYKSIFDLARYESQKQSSPYSSAAKRYWSGMTLRKNVLYNAEEKFEAVRAILKAYPTKK